MSPTDRLWHIRCRVSCVHLRPQPTTRPRGLHGTMTPPSAPWAPRHALAPSGRGAAGRQGCPHVGLPARHVSSMYGRRSPTGSPSTTRSTPAPLMTRPTPARWAVCCPAPGTGAVGSVSGSGGCLAVVRVVVVVHPFARPPPHPWPSRAPPTRPHTSQEYVYKCLGVPMLQHVFSGWPPVARRPNPNPDAVRLLVPLLALTRRHRPCPAPLFPVTGITCACSPTARPAPARRTR